MTAKQAAVKKYVVKLSDEERERLSTLIRTGKHRARQLMKARILLKADASEAGEGWSDSQIASALDTTVNTVARTRQRLVEQGFEAALTHKHSPASTRPRIFDGAAEAKLVALACSKPPKGRVRWTLQLLETAVVELSIVDRASDNTIGRTLKKTYVDGPGSSKSHLLSRSASCRALMTAVSPVRTPSAARPPGALRYNREAPARPRALPPLRCLRGLRAGCPATPEIGPAGPPASAPRQPTVAVDCADRRADGIRRPPAVSLAQPRR